MKRIIIIIAIMFMAATSGYAQFYKGFGIKAGTSIANLDFDYRPSNGVIYIFGEGHNQYKYGLTIGIFKEIPVVQNLRTQIGINYSQKGCTVEFDGYNANYTERTGNTYTIHNNLEFITAEVYAKYTSTGSVLNPYLLAGLRIDFPLLQYTFTFHDGKYTSNYSQGVTNNKLFGATLGAGLDYQASKLFSVFLEATYNPDFTYITDVDNGFKVRGRSFDIRTGIKF